MLPVYQAISFQGVLEKGARTKPWLALVMTDHGIERYVVKLFETKLIDEKDSVANEVLGNVLAREFNLPVPEAAFIQFGPSFIATIGDPALRALLGERDSRLKFGCKLMDGYIRFDPGSFSTSEARKHLL